MLVGPYVIVNIRFCLVEAGGGGNIGSPLLWAMKREVFVIDSSFKIINPQPTGMAV